MKSYIVKTTFTFTGTFKVKAENKQQAREQVEKDCGCVLGSGIHSTLDDNQVDWDFPIHPETKINSIK